MYTLESSQELLRIDGKHPCTKAERVNVRIKHVTWDRWYPPMTAHFFVVSGIRRRLVGKSQNFVGKNQRLSKQSLDQNANITRIDSRRYLVLLIFHHPFLRKKQGKMIITEQTMLSAAATVNWLCHSNLLRLGNIKSRMTQICSPFCTLETGNNLQIWNFCDFKSNTRARV